MSPSNCPETAPGAGVDAPVSDREDVRYRERTREVESEAFERVRDRIDGGLDWGVGAFVTDRAGRLLLVFEDGRWLLPGGGVEDGEGHREALAREVDEETGLAVAVGDCLVVTEQSFACRGQRATFHFAVYEATPESTDVTDDPGLPGEDIEAVEWFDRPPENTLDRELLVDLH